MNNLAEHLKICLITFPLLEIKGGHPLVENLLQILEPLSKQISVITGNYPKSAIFSPKIRLKNVKHESKKSLMLIRTSKYVITQLKISYNFVKVANEVNVVIFFIGGTALLLPMLTAKLLRKRTILIATASQEKVAEKCYRQSLFGEGGFIFSRIISILEGLDYRLSDAIVVYSSSIIYQLRLVKYQDKIFSTGARFVNTGFFQPKKSLGERGNLVGYFGRLSEEKGIMNFVNAIPLILKQYNNIQFLIAGEGSDAAEIKERLKNKRYGAKVIFAGWIPHEELPDYLNELRLLVNPSYTDTGPQIVFEAMACGTPVLSTSVGTVPDTIKDGENGFIMENNSPECIAKNVIRSLSHPNLEEIIKKARTFIEKEYCYEAALKRYENLLSNFWRNSNADKSIK